MRLAQSALRRIAAEAMRHVKTHGHTSTVGLERVLLTISPALRRRIRRLRRRILWKEAR